MRFDSYMVRGYDGSEDDSGINTMAVRPSEKDAHMIRKCIIEEMEAVNDYIERAGMAENSAVRKVLLDIAEEERIHFGEFEMLLDAIDPLHEPAEDEAEEEMEDIFGENDYEE